jgi:hypothetical protein
LGIVVKIFDGESSRDFKLPSKWEEITLSTYLDIKANGLAKGLIKSEVEEDQEDLLLKAMPFLKRKIKAVVPDYIKDINIASDEWGKLEHTKIILDKEKEELKALSGIVKIYKGFEILDRSMPEVMGVQSEIFSQLNKFFDRFKELAEYQPEQDELQAGIDELDQFGFFNTVDRLAGGDVLKHDLILKEPALKIYNKLLKDYIDAKIQKRLHKIRSKKK